jgi:hypothetical protein
VRVRRALRRAIALLVPTLAALVAYATLRPNRAYPPGAPDGLESWPVVADGRHNSNTDLIRWRDAFWLAHAAAPWHFRSERTRIVLQRSADARRFEPVASLAWPGEDVRDPKLAVLNDRLFLYFLPNRSFPAPKPYTTLVTSSADGVAWEQPAEVEPQGWLLWRPKLRADGVWVPAYWHEHGRAVLLRSHDGRRFAAVSEIVSGSSGDETDMEFLDDGRILASSRLEGARPDAWFGDPDGETQIALASPPYASWVRSRDRAARLDGPCLFRWQGRIFAVARYEPEARGGVFETGSILGRKRTALYLVEPGTLRVLGILPSDGDTAYAGVVLQDGWLYVSYYTSRVDRDYPWILGMLSPSEIRIARLPLATLARLADAARGKGA